MVGLFLFIAFRHISSHSIAFDTFAETQHCKWKAIQGVVRRAAKLAWEVNPDAVRVMAVYPLTGCPSAVQFLEIVYNAVIRG